MTTMSTRRGPRAARRHALLVLAALVALAAPPARAHDFWIEPSSFHPAVGERVAVRLRVGDEFPGEPVPRSPGRIERFALVGAAGEDAVIGLADRDPAGWAVAAQPGLYLLVYDSNHARLSLPADRFEQHLAEQGLERVSALRRERGQSGVAGTEIYSRCAKALLAVAPAPTGGASPVGGHDRRLGLPLELVPESDPYALAGGGRLPLLLLYQGRPLAGAWVEARGGSGEPPRRVSGRTDAAGRVALDLPGLPGSGFWLVKAVHMIEAPAGGDADWESFWASLTFEIPPPAAGAEAGPSTDAAIHERIEEEIEVTSRASDLVGIVDSASEGVAIEDVHFHPAEPRAFRLAVEWRR